MSSKIESIDLAWNLQHRQGLVRIRLASGQTADFAVDGISDLAGWAALKKQGPLVLSSNGWVHKEDEAPLEGTEVPFPFA